jgi:stage V sporulation protein G
MPSRKIKQPCPKCGFKNELRSKYCNQCAAQLPFAPRPATAEAASNAQLEHKDIAHPITQSFREYLQKRILEAYEQEKTKGPSSFGQTAP